MQATCFSGIISILNEETPMKDMRDEMFKRLDAKKASDDALAMKVIWVAIVASFVLYGVTA